MLIHNFQSQTCKCISIKAINEKTQRLIQFLWPSYCFTWWLLVSCWFVKQMKLYIIDTSNNGLCWVIVYQSSLFIQRVVVESWGFLVNIAYAVAILSFISLESHVNPDHFRYATIFRFLFGFFIHRSKWDDPVFISLLWIWTHIKLIFVAHLCFKMCTLTNSMYLDVAPSLFDSFIMSWFLLLFYFYFCFA